MEGKKRAAVFCILVSGDSFLLLNRSKEPNKGKLVPPGGKIEAYESPNDAVIREVCEETGISLSEAKLCGILTETSPTPYNWISYIYIAHVDYVVVPECDEGTFHWIPISELQNIETPPTDLYIYQLVAQKKSFILNAIYNEDLLMTEIVDELTGDTLFKK